MRAAEPLESRKQGLVALSAVERDDDRAQTPASLLPDPALAWAARMANVLSQEGASWVGIHAEVAQMGKVNLSW